MERVKILAIAPYQGMAEIMNRQADRRKDIELTVEVGNAHTCRQILHRRNEYEYDAIVSRGGTAKVLRAAATAPVVEIPVSVYDMLRCLKSLQGYNGKVAVIGFSNITQCAVELSSVMQYQLDVCTITEQSDVKAELIKLRQAGIGLVLCDQISRSQAEELGMNAVLLTSDEASIATAFDEAVNVCRRYGDFHKRNEIMRTLLFAQEQQSVFFDGDGQLLFSTLHQNTPYEGFQEELEKMLPEFFSCDTLERECKWGGAVLMLSSSRPLWRGQKCLLIQIKTSQQPLSSEYAEVSISTRADQMLGEISQIGNAVLMGETGALITSCYPCKVPVLIIGEVGTGKDTVASLIYRYGAFRDRMMVTVDCETVNPRRWKALLSRENSPFMRSGITIYLRSVNRMENDQAEMLFGFIEQTCLHRRNRLIFSSSAGQRVTEDEYAVSYLKNHFSTIVLRLPPLRQRRNDIPSIAALYINQVNAELGKHYIGFEPEAMALLQRFGWEENLTQLNRVVRMLALVGEKPYIGEEEVRQILKRELPPQLLSPGTGYSTVNLRQPLHEITYDIVRLVLEEEEGNQSRTAERLKISRSTVWGILKRKGCIDQKTDAV